MSRSTKVAIFTAILIFGAVQCIVLMPQLVFATAAGATLLHSD